MSYDEIMRAARVFRVCALISMAAVLVALFDDRASSALAWLVASYSQSSAASALDEWAEERLEDHKQEWGMVE